MPTSQTITIHESIPVDAISDLTRDEVLIANAFNWYLDFISPKRTVDDGCVPLSWDERLLFNPESSLEVMLAGAVLLLMHCSKGVSINSANNRAEKYDLIDRYDPDGVLEGMAYGFLLSGRLMPKGTVGLKAWALQQIKLMEVKCDLSKRELDYLDEKSKRLESESKYIKRVLDSRGQVDMVIRLSVVKGAKTEFSNFLRNQVIRSVIESRGYICSEFEAGLKTMTVDEIERECAVRDSGLFKNSRSDRSFRENYWRPFKRSQKKTGT